MLTLMDDVTTIAHKAVYKCCGILHCNISPSNILISKNGGLLIDWDLCKNVNLTKHKARCATRMVRIECLLICTTVLINWNQGTWQFMAANLITDPEISQTFVHDLESAFYVMFWLSLRYLPNSYHPSTRGHILSNVFNLDPPDSPLSLGPSSLDSHCKPSTDSKVTWMVTSDNVEDFKVTGNDPLSCLLSELKQVFSSWHVTSSTINAVINRWNMVQPSKKVPDGFWEQFSEEPTLEYSHVLKKFKKALQEEWPRDDSPQLQKVILPAKYQMVAISRSKRSRSMMFKSHNLEPIHSEPIHSSSSKQQKN